MKDNVLTVNFNDVFSKEEKAVLIRLDVIQAPTEAVSFDVHFEYDDVQFAMNKVSESAQLLLHPTSEKALHDSGVNVKVLEQIALFVSNDLFERAMENCDNRDFAEARAKIRTSLSYLEELKEKTGSESELMEQQNKIIREYESRMDFMEQESQEEFSMGQKMSKMSNYSSKRRK